MKRSREKEREHREKLTRARALVERDYGREGASPGLCERAGLPAGTLTLLAKRLGIPKPPCRACGVVALYMRGLCRPCYRGEKKGRPAVKRPARPPIVLNIKALPVRKPVPRAEEMRRARAWQWANAVRKGPVPEWLLAKDGWSMAGLEAVMEESPGWFRRAGGLVELTWRGRDAVLGGAP